MRGQDYGTPFSETASGTARAIATHTGTAGRTYYVTEISGSADPAAAATTIVLSQGSTTLWQDAIPNSLTGTWKGVYIKNFSTPLAGASGASVSVSVGTATSITTANIAGYELLM